MVIGCLRLCDVSVICRVVNPRRTLQNIWEVSCTECKGQENDFELIPTIKMKLENSVEGYFRSEFAAICSNCGVMAAGSRKTLQNWRFFEKQFLKVKFFGEIARCLPDKKSPGSPAFATARIAPKICQGQPPKMYPECSRFHPNRFTFGGVIAERVNTTKTRRI